MSSTELPPYITLIDAPMHEQTKVLSSYLIQGEKNVLIDPGSTTQTIEVAKTLKKRNIEELMAVLATHIHLDHNGGSWMLLDEYPEAFLHCHPRGAPHMNEPSKLKAAAEKLFGDMILQYGEIKGIPEEKINSSNRGEVIELGGVTLEVYWTPGHSSHSQCYFEPDSRTIFVGDAIGNSLGELGPFIPTSPPPHNPVQAVESMEFIRDLSPETLCIAHYGAYKEPRKFIDRLIERTNLWKDLSFEAVNEDWNLDELVEQVILQDTELKEKTEKFKDLLYPVRDSLLGFYLYADWIKDRETS